MKRLLKISLILFLACSVFGQGKPMMGTPIDISHPLSDFVAFWPGFEGSGNKVFDFSGNGNDGTFQGTALSWSAGKFGSAVLLPGTDEYIDVSSLVNHIDKAQGTLVLWCNFTTAALSDSTQHSMFEIGYSLDNDDVIALRKTSGNEIVMRYRKDDVNVNATIAVIGGLTGLHQYVGTWGSGSLKIYLDGVLQDADTFITLTGTLNQAFIGNNGQQIVLDVFDGLIEVASAYNRALSAGEIALLYREPFCMFQQDVPLMAIEAPPAPTGGQVIIIQMSAATLGIAFMFLGFWINKRAV